MISSLRQDKAGFRGEYQPRIPVDCRKRINIMTGTI
jgi:hypothetical protein